MAAETNASPKLDDRIAALPQELYDQIYEETFTVGANIVTIDSDYRPPSILQVSRETRTKAMRQYHSRSQFGGKIQTIGRWAVSLAERERGTVKEFRWYIDRGSIPVKLPGSKETKMFDRLEFLLMS